MPIMVKPEPGLQAKAGEPLDPVSTEQLAAALSIYASLVGVQIGQKISATMADSMRSAANALLSGQKQLDKVEARAATLERTVEDLSKRCGDGARLCVDEYKWGNSQSHRIDNFRAAIVNLLKHEHAEGRLSHFSVSEPSSYGPSYGFLLGLVGPPKEVERVHEQINLMWKSIA